MNAIKFLVIGPLLAGSAYASQLTREIKSAGAPTVTSSETCANSKDVAAVGTDIVEYVPVEKGKKMRLFFRVPQSKDISFKGATVCEYSCDKGTEPYIVSLKGEGVKSLVACVLIQKGH